MKLTARVQQSRPVPSALTPAPFNHSLLLLNRYAEMSAVIRLAYGLPEAEFAALLDRIEVQVTRIVLDRLHG